MMSPDLASLGQRLAAALAAGTLDAGVLEAMLTHARTAPLAAYSVTARRLRAVAAALYPAVPMDAMLIRAPDLAWLLIHSPNGFHRDAALLQVPVPAHPLDLAALLARLDDWVPKVRLLAEDRLARLAPLIQAETVARVLIARQRRIEGAWRMSPAGHRLWQALVARDDVQERLIAHFLTDQGRPIRQIFLRWAETPAGDTHLPQLAREAAHPSIRASALWWLMDGQVSYTSPRPAFVPDHGWQPVAARRLLSITADPATLTHAAARDRSAQVRKVAAEMLRRYAQTDPDAARALARQLTDDRNKGVRERALWFLTPR